jgi:hypothetical protein
MLRNLGNLNIPNLFAHRLCYIHIFLRAMFHTSDDAFCFSFQLFKSLSGTLASSMARLILATAAETATKTVMAGDDRLS